MDIQSYIDRSGLIKPHLAWADSSGDGVIITVVAGMLGVYDKERCNQAVIACIDKQTGCLMRRPTNENGQSSHDSWMALAVWLAYTGNGVLARGLLLSAIPRFFYMKHRPFELEGKTWKEKLKIIFEPWMGRFPKIWLTLIATAYPFRFIRWTCIKCIGEFMSASLQDISDQSATQLQWLDRMAMKILGDESELDQFYFDLKNLGLTMGEAMCRAPDPFYDPEQPIIGAYSKAKNPI